MNDLPRDSTNDLSSFAGTYPQSEESGSDQTAVKKPSGSNQNQPATQTPNETDQISPPAASDQPVPGQTPEPPTLADSTPFQPSTETGFTASLDQPSPHGVPPPEAMDNPLAPQTQPPSVSSDQHTTTPLTDSGGQPTATVPPAENPFVYQTNQATVPPPPPKSRLKRILAILLFIIALIVLGYLGFTLIGRFLNRSQSVVLTYWGLWEQEGVLANLFEQYKQAHPNVEIVYSKQSPRQYRERLQAALQRGEGPDIFRFHNTWVPMLKEELDTGGEVAYSVTEFQQTFYPVAAQNLIDNNQIVGVPLMIDGLGLYYNEDLLRAAGVTPPSSWEQFRQDAFSLTVKDASGKIVTAGAALGTTNNIEHFSDILGVMMIQNGASFAKLNSLEAEQALLFYQQFAMPPDNVWDESLDNSILAFADGKVAFIFAPSWQVHTIREINPTLNFKIIPIPQIPGTNTTWASYWVEGVSARSKYKEAAWELLKFLSSREALIALYTEASKERAFGEPYSRIDLAQTVINDPFVGAYIRQAPTAQSFFLASRTFDNGINDRLIKYIQDAVNSLFQGVSVEAAVETASQGFSEVLTSYDY